MKNIFKENLIQLGKTADQIKRDLIGDKVFFVRNIHLNYTNICVNHCKFCAFAKDEGENGAYEMDINNVIKYLKDRWDDYKEIHIVGGLHPSKKFDYYLGMLRSIKYEFPNAAIKAFSAVEIDYFTKISGLSDEGVLIKLKDAGLDMMPGGGAEIFAESVRNIICPEKISGERWLSIMEVAHSCGIKSNATMLYGHVESDEDRIDHLIKIKKLQDKTGGFLAFIPLSFHPQNTFLDHIFPATGVDDLKNIAVSRIILENIPHIKAYWVMLGEKTAQTALHFGADDIDGTIVKENITHAAGAKSSEGLTLSDLVYFINSAGFIPVERDAFYNEIQRF